MEPRFVPMRDARSTVSAGAHCSDGWDVDTPWHYHDMHQLLYAFEGALEIEGQEGRYTVPRQFAAWVPAGTVHRTTIQKVASGSVFLSPALLGAEAGSPKVIAAPAILREMVMHAMRWPLERAEEDAVSTAFFGCFAHLCAEWIADERHCLLPSSRNPRIQAIMDHSREHVATLTFGQLAAFAGMSERSLRRHFQRETGMSWEAWRQRLRLHLALDKLDRTTRPIGVIAAEVGYDNQSAFARGFRQHLGIGPKEYRRQR